MLPQKSKKNKQKRQQCLRNCTSGASRERRSVRHPQPTLPPQTCRIIRPPDSRNSVAKCKKTRAHRALADPNPLGFAKPHDHNPPCRPCGQTQDKKKKKKQSQEKAPRFLQRPRHTPPLAINMPLHLLRDDHLRALVARNRRRVPHGRYRSPA